MEFQYNKQIYILRLLVPKAIKIITKPLYTEIFNSITTRRKIKVIFEYNPQRTVVGHFTTHPFPSITINLARISVEKELVETLAHELAHYRQFLDGKLQFDWKGPWWCGKPFLRSGFETFEEYKQLPWEVEAWKVSEVVNTFFTRLTNPQEKIKVNPFWRWLGLIEDVVCGQLDLLDVDIKGE